MSVDPVEQPLRPLSGPPPDLVASGGVGAIGGTDLRRLSVRELIRALTAVEDARRLGDDGPSTVLAAQEAAILAELHGRPAGPRPVDGPGSGRAPGVGEAGGAGGSGGTASPAGRSADRPVGAPRLVVLPGSVPDVVVPDVVVTVQPAPTDPHAGDV